MDFDFTPISMAVDALRLYYTDYIISIHSDYTEERKRAVVCITAASKNKTNVYTAVFVVPVYGLETNIEYGDHIKNLLVDNGLPLVPPKKSI